MADQLFGINDSDASRLERMLRWFESKRRIPGESENDNAHNLQVLRCIDVVTEDGYYPCVVEYYDLDDEDWLPVLDGDDTTDDDRTVYAIDAAGAGLKVSGRYLARQYGDVTTDEDVTFPLFVIAGINSVICRVYGIGVSFNSRVYYPAYVQLLDTDTGTYADGPPVWLTQRLGASLTTGGTGNYPAVYYGSVEAATDDSRPLFITTMRPYVVGIDCSGGVTTPIFNP